MSQLFEGKNNSNVVAEGLHNQSQKFVNAMRKAFDVDIHTHTHLR